MDVAGAQSAWTGLALSNFTITEGTDATGGEMNIGSRLLTGVADGRVAAGSSDAVNGHQLNAVAVQVDDNRTDIDANTTAIDDNRTDIDANTSAIDNVTTVINNTGDDVDQLALVVGDNRTDIDANTIAIGDNRTDIDANTIAIGDNRIDIEANTTAIAGISTGVGDLTDRVTANEETNDWQDTDIAANAETNDWQDMDIASNTEMIATEASRNDTQAIAINQNAGSITENSAAILGNNQLIVANQNLIGRNYGLILDNAERIDKLAKGVAMSMSVPDAYLDKSESLSIAGGLGTFDGEVGFGAAITIRGNDNWSFSAGSALAGGEFGGKVSARWSR